MQALRALIFRPYRKGPPDKWPTFRLETWDSGELDQRGQTKIAYRFVQLGPAMRYGLLKRETIFQGKDFAGSPLHADDSDATMASLMGFLTLRPGDTDAEYFANYTDGQRAFVDSHAEALAFEVQARFGDR